MNRVELTKKMMLNFIESEIANYYYHVGMAQKIDKKIDETRQEYYDRLGSPMRSTSVIKVSKNGSPRNNWIVSMESKINELEEKRDAELAHVEMVDRWLSEIPFEEKHLQVIELSVKKGVDPKTVSEEVGCKENSVYKIKNRVFSKILSRFF